MKNLYCWRCRMTLPMLDEKEFAPIKQLYSDALRSIKDFRRQHALPLEGIDIAEHMSPVCKAYNELTGFHETNADAIMHHRISLYGPICPDCRKPFRTPRASFCAACGHRPAPPR